MASLDAGDGWPLASRVLVAPDITGDPVILVSTLAAHAAARLSAYKRPTRIILTGALPAAATGKVLKHRLVAHFADLLGL